jgi:hypothetical protein
MHPCVVRCGHTPGQRTDNAWAAIGSSSRLVPHADRLLGLMVVEERPPKRQKGNYIVRPCRQGVSKLAYSLVIAMRVEQSPPDGMAGRSERVKIAGTAGLHQCLLHTSMAQQAVRESVVGSSVVRIQTEGAPVFILGLGPLPLSDVHACQQDMRVGEIRI